MSVVDYTEAIKIIEDGDIIFIHGRPSDIIQAVIMFTTGSRFSHCMIAFHVSICEADTIMCVEAQGSTKRRIVPLSLYRDHLMTVVAAPERWEDVKHVALRDIGVAKYNLLRAIYIGISEYCERKWKFKLPALRRLNEVCSDFCGDVYEIKETGSPQVLYEQLMDITEER